MSQYNVRMPFQMAFQDDMSSWRARAVQATLATLKQATAPNDLITTRGLQLLSCNKVIVPLNWASSIHVCNV